MFDFPRLIEHAFPLVQASIDSVHEKNVRQGHISTLHIWPARRPLAAARAALIATLLPDPGDAKSRQELCEKIGGKIVEQVEKKKMPTGKTVERIKEETVGGILHWGREREHPETMQWFRDQIREAFGGRPPKVLDPFSGGGAIPLEAMRLGCDVTAVDINPVAWFTLKCTLEYPQKLAGQIRPLPEFILEDEAFMAEFFAKAKGYGKVATNAAIKRLRKDRASVATAPANQNQKHLGFDSAAHRDGELDADITWHVRAWGQWALKRVRRELASMYPTYADFESVSSEKELFEHEHQMKLVPLTRDGMPDIDALNHEFSPDYLAEKRRPRWIAKPTVAYMWARTVACKNCRATVPLLKTRWLCKRPAKRVLLAMEPNNDRTGVVYGIQKEVPVTGGNAAQRREHDKRLGAGTMSRSGAECPCCKTINTMEDIRVAGRAGRLGREMTCVAIDSPRGKAYRLPTDIELAAASPNKTEVEQRLQQMPYGPLNEPTPAGGGSGAGRAFSVQGYGLMRWRDLFSDRQLISLSTFVEMLHHARDEMHASGLSDAWLEATSAYLCCAFDRTLDFNSQMLSWISSVEAIRNTFGRFALPMNWDFCEAVPINDVRGGWEMCLGAVMESQPVLADAGAAASSPPRIRRQSATQPLGESVFDAIVTDPPYYDAIPYSDLMDYFYVWQRRVLAGLSPEIDAAQAEPLGPKWSRDRNDGELIDDASRHDNDKALSKKVYEDGMTRVFEQCAVALKPEGRLVIVFANKQADAWETLVSAIIRAGFVVDGSWPIRTEQAARMRAQASAALASSVWLVAKKRPIDTRPGWDNNVLQEMQANVETMLTEFWAAGIRGPDFVWAATGPALAAYSKYPAVRKANEPNAIMSVSEFLEHVRRMVVEFVLNQLPGMKDQNDDTVVDRLDDVTAYYLLHRSAFHMDDAPIGACILYATACGLTDVQLDKVWGLISHSAKTPAAADTEEDDSGDSSDDSEEDAKTETGGSARLKGWQQRRSRSLGYDAPEGKAVPLIDRLHRIMLLWSEGDVAKVDAYLDDHALRKNELFKRMLQSLIELAETSDRAEKTLLEKISNHIGMKSAARATGPRLFADDSVTAESSTSE
jgi:putative DNA methylase